MNQFVPISQLQLHELTADPPEHLPEPLRQISVAIEFVTPAKAREYLATSAGNRNIRKTVVTRYRNQMNRGVWHLTHQGVAFNSDRHLADGHHTLTALSEADVSGVWLLVVRGLPTESFVAVDCGARRDVADRAHFLGFEQDKVDAAIARLWVRLDPQRTQTLDDQELIEFVEQRKASMRWARNVIGGAVDFQNAVWPTMLAIAHHYGQHETLNDWFRIVSSGMPTEPWQSCAVRLRDWWFQNQRPAKGAGGDFRAAACGRIFHSMSAWQQQRPLKVIKQVRIAWFD